MPVKVGGGKQTYMGNIGCTTKYFIFKTTPRAENFYNTSAKPALGYAGMGATQKDLHTQEDTMRMAPPGFLGEGKQFGDMGYNAITPVMMDPLCLDGHTALKSLGLCIGMA